MLGPVLAISASPLLAYRQPVYILASFAGGIAMALLVIQPLLPNNDMPGLTRRFGRMIHRGTGAVLVAMLAVHIGGLWITSPPDVVDALLLRSPTPFSIWGVLAMWGVIVTAALAAWRRKLKPKTWQRGHVGLAALIAVGTVFHVILIDGTMGNVGKAVLSGAVVLATGLAVWRVWRPRRA
nr:ferric reductase-like transmembrane domain-containing protein [Octadecabacter dasysiphoniae]